MHLSTMKEAVGRRDSCSRTSNRTKTRIVQLLYSFATVLFCSVYHGEDLLFYTIVWYFWQIFGGNLYPKSPCSQEEPRCYIVALENSCSLGVAGVKTWLSFPTQREIAWSATRRRLRWHLRLREQQGPSWTQKMRTWWYFLMLSCHSLPPPHLFLSPLSKEEHETVVNSANNNNIVA